MILLSFHTNNSATEKVNFQGGMISRLVVVALLGCPILGQHVRALLASSTWESSFATSLLRELHRVTLLRLWVFFHRSLTIYTFSKDRRRLIAGNAKAYISLESYIVGRPVHETFLKSLKSRISENPEYRQVKWFWWRDQCYILTVLMLFSASSIYFSRSASSTACLSGNTAQWTSIFLRYARPLCSWERGCIDWEICKRSIQGVRNVHLRRNKEWRFIQSIYTRFHFRVVSSHDLLLYHLTLTLDYRDSLHHWIDSFRALAWRRLQPTGDKIYLYIHFFPIQSRLYRFDRNLRFFRSLPRNIPASKAGLW